MTFDAFETADGTPIELLTFSNGNEQFFSTNAIVPFQNGANLHLPLAYERTAFAQSKDTDDTNIRMTVPNDFGVVNLYAGVLTSNRTLVTIERFHLDDPANQIQVVWKGVIASLEHQEFEVQILLRPLTTGTEQTPPDTFSGLCNSFLFESPGCDLNRDDFRFIATLSAVSADGLEHTFNGLRNQAETLDLALASPTGPLSSAELDIYWQGGHLQTGAGEIRSIIEGNVGADPDTIRVDLPFRNFIVTDGANVFAGCDLSLATCAKKFDNAIRHQGFPYIPERDPANTELPPGTRTSSSSFAG